MNPRLSETRAPVRARESDRQVCPVCVTYGDTGKPDRARAHINTRSRTHRGSGLTKSINRFPRPATVHFLTAWVKHRSHTVLYKVVPAGVQQAFVSTPLWCYSCAVGMSRCPGAGMKGASRCPWCSDRMTCFWGCMSNLNPSCGQKMMRI